MSAGLALFYVGAVLCLNGLWVLGRIGDKEVAVIDIFVGGITLLVSLQLACWVAWGILWFLFFLLLVMQKPIAKYVGTLAVIEGIFTGWLPGYLLLNGFLK